VTAIAIGAMPLAALFKKSDREECPAAWPW